MKRKRANKREIERIGELLACMTRQTELYKLVRERVQAMGNWKAAPRGRDIRRNLSNYQRRANTFLDA